MTNTNSDELNTTADKIGLRERFLANLRRDAPLLATGAIGGVAIGTVAVLAASGLAPLLVGSMAATAVSSWLQSMGGNALAGWLGDWSLGAGKHFLRQLQDGKLDAASQREALATALDEQMVSDIALREAVEHLLEETQAITTAVQALKTSEERDALLGTLRQELRQNTQLLEEINHLQNEILVKLDAVHNEVRAAHAGPPLLLTTAEFFRPFLSKAKLFNHTWALVGRQDTLGQLHEFAQSVVCQVAILVGRGGVGKTKILQAFAEEFEKQYGSSFTLRFVADNLSLAQMSLQDIPSEPCLLILDDAHRRDQKDIQFLLAAARQRQQPLKLIFSSRPQASDHLRSILCLHKIVSISPNF